MLTKTIFNTEYSIYFDKATESYDLTGIDKTNGSLMTFQDITKNLVLAEHLLSVLTENEVELVHVKDVIADFI